MGTDQLHAVIFTRPGHGAARRSAECWQHCHHHGYQVAATIVGDITHWPDVMDLLAADTAQVIVIHDWDDLPVARLPRVEVATEAPLSARRVRRLPRD